MRKLFERIVDFMEENGSIQSEYRDVYLFALQTVAVYAFNIGTIVKENQILKRERKYSLYYGEKILLIFNNGGTEIELHYKNMKPSER